MKDIAFIEFLEEYKINPSPNIMGRITSSIVEGKKITNLKFMTLFEDLIDDEI